MIYTITFSPCLDYTVQVEDFKLGKISRSIGEEIYPGGKGINVSIVLKNLGVESTALGFVGGFTGEEITRLVKEQNVKTDFITVLDGFSRINIKIRSHEETDVNGQGCRMSQENIDELFLKLNRLIDGDVLILAGSIPNMLPDDIYERILQLLDGKDIQTVVDATGDLLVNVLKYHPFLIKPNDEELGEIFHTTFSDDDAIILHAKKLQQMGARNVLVSMGSKGAILVCEDGSILQRKPPHAQVVNTVGAGDSMVAGFVAGYRQSGNYEEALKLGTAAGSATASRPWLAQKEDIDHALLTMIE